MGWERLFPVVCRLSDSMRSSSTIFRQ
jgi:hypothetical protein